MLTLNEFLTFEHDLEHDSEHDLAHKKDFSLPKIYTANGDLSKRWYVYFSYRNPSTGHLKRQKNIYGNSNTLKNKEDRLALLTRYRRRLLKLLNEGFNPYADNSELYKTQLAKKDSGNTAKAPSHKALVPQVKYPNAIDPKPKIESKEELESANTDMTLREAFDFSLELKANEITSRSLKDYKYSTNAVIKWAQNNRPILKTINQFDKKAALDFLNFILKKSSPRNRNNYRLNLSSLLQTLEDNEIIVSNPMKKIAPLRSIPKRNKSYSTEEHEEIFEYLKKEDPILLLYIKFISYNFLRPIEVCRLKIKDINIEDRKIQFRAKNSPLKTKIIPQILIEELPDLSTLNPDYYLFTPIKLGGEWDATDVNKSTYFSKRYRKVVKEHFKLDADQTLYSFRHTFIGILYGKMLKDSSPFEAKSRLMEITGHKTMDALEKYLRNIDAFLPDDYSDLF